MITHETKTEFAERCGVNKGTVTRWHQAGRLVVDEQGWVDIDASLQLLESTRGIRFDVADRWRAYRAEQAAAEQQASQRAAASAQPPATQAQQPATPGDSDQDSLSSALDLDEIGHRTRVAQMLKEEAIARQKQREDALMEGAVIRRADVRKDLTDATAVIISAWENLPDRVAPLLVDLSDQARIRALLRDEVERIGHEVAQQLQRTGEQTHSQDTTA